jgi:alpha-galactosidase
MSYRIAMVGAGSFFTDGITEGLCRAKEIFAGSTFVLFDVDRKRLRESEARNQAILKKMGGQIKIVAMMDRRKALEGCDYVVSSCEKKRVAYWAKDIEIPLRFDAQQFYGENGGPGGQAHAMRNITIFMGVCKDMREVCPDAWLMNFTNPMSFVCTYFNRYSGVRALGFCHQVHGSLGVVAEMLGFQPGELQAITGGVNHFNWLIDIRRRGTGESYMQEFKARVMKNKYWQKIFKNIPEQVFTLDVFKTFGEYPVGYDTHILEYLPFFYPPAEWKKRGYEPRLEALRREMKQAKARSKASRSKIAAHTTKARAEFYNFPFPKDGQHPYYKELPTEVMEAFETNKPLYLTSIVIPNNGAIDNLPTNAMVDIPGIAVGGEVRGVHVGPLPAFGAELCRRQIAIHELLTAATVTADRQKVVQSMALDPYVRTIEQARKITDAFLKTYRKELPQFWK